MSILSDYFMFYFSLGPKSPGKMVMVQQVKGESNFGKMRPFRRGRYFDKVRRLYFYLIEFNCTFEPQFRVVIGF